jgi:tetratricopeptide (TPR) repeat protein
MQRPIHATTGRFGRVVFLLLFSTATLALEADARQQGNERRDAWLRQQVVRGSTRLYVDDFAGAERIFEEALKILPENPTLLASLAQAKAGQDDYASAAFFLGRALKADPDNVSLWRLAASLRSRAGDPTGLLEAYRSIARLEPGDARVRLDQIELLTRLEAYSDALEVANEAILEFEPGLQFLQRRADLLQKLGRTTEYEETLRRIVKTDPADTESQMRLATSLLQAGRGQEGETVLRGVLRVDPGCEEAARTLADLLREQGRDGEADELLAGLRANDFLPTETTASDSTAGSATIASLRSRLAGHPDGVGEMRDLANALRATSQCAEAAELFLQITRQEPRDLDSWIAGIDCFLQADAPNRALEMTDLGLSLFPGYVPLLLLRAESLFDAGRTDDAIEQTRTLRERPLDAGQRTKLEALLRRLDAM